MSINLSICCVGVSKDTKRPGKGQSCEDKEEEEEEDDDLEFGFLEYSILGGNKMGLQMIPPFYLQNGTTEDRIYGSSQATILNTQARQLFETIPILKLRLGQTNAADLVQSSPFLHGSFILRQKCYSPDSMCILVQNPHNAKARKIICKRIRPRGCHAANRTNQSDNEENNQSILRYNVMLSEQRHDPNANFFDAHTIFCDAYQGLVPIPCSPMTATGLVQSSLFYISLGIDDYIQLLLHCAFGLREQCYSLNYARSILVKHTIQNHDNAKARKMSCMGIGPQGCATCSPWEAYNASNRNSADVRYPNEEINYASNRNSADVRYPSEEINLRILPYNVMLSEQLLTLT